MKRFTVVNEGYNMEEVNRFIDIVIKRLEKLNNENAMYSSEFFMDFDYDNTDDYGDYDDPVEYGV